MRPSLHSSDTMTAVPKKSCVSEWTAAHRREICFFTSELVVPSNLVIDGDCDRGFGLRVLATTVTVAQLVLGRNRFPTPVGFKFRCPIFGFIPSLCFRSDDVTSKLEIGGASGGGLIDVTVSRSSTALWVFRRHPWFQYFFLMAQGLFPHKRDGSVLVGFPSTIPGCFGDYCVCTYSSSGVTLLLPSCIYPHCQKDSNYWSLAWMN